MLLFLNSAQSKVHNEWGRTGQSRLRTQHINVLCIRIYRSDIILLLNLGASNILLNARKNRGYFVTSDFNLFTRLISDIFSFSLPLRPFALLFSLLNNNYRKSELVRLLELFYYATQQMHVSDIIPLLIDSCVQLPR